MAAFLHPQLIVLHIHLLHLLFFSSSNVADIVVVVGVIVVAVAVAVAVVVVVVVVIAVLVVVAQLPVNSI